MKKLVLLGGGYGNMRILAKLLPNNIPSDVQITLVDRNPYHCLKTEYYALAAGTISDQHIRVSFPEHEQLTIKYGVIENINLEENFITFNDQSTLEYDQVIIGLGCEDKYHNVPGAKEHTLSIQTIEKSRATYSIVNNLAPHSVVAVVGAGLSGVEFASELIESRPDLQVLLFDRGNRILSMFPEKLSQYVTTWFNQHAITVVSKSNITKVEPGFLYNHDVPVKTDLIVWTAGVQTSEVVQKMDVDKDAMGRVQLTPLHFIEKYPNAFVIGDCASLPHAPSAQLAEGQGEQIVTILQKLWKNEELPESLPTIKLKGTLGSLGKKHGFGFMANQTLLGRVPRLLKSGILWLYKYHNG